MTRKAPRHVARSRVAWIDTDAGGRIHFTAAFRWAEAAETALLRSLGLLDDWGDYPRRAVEAEYLAVLRFEDEFELELTAENVGDDDQHAAAAPAAGDRARRAHVHDELCHLPTGSAASADAGCTRHLGVEDLVQQAGDR